MPRINFKSSRGTLATSPGFSTEVAKSKLCQRCMLSCAFAEKEVTRRKARNKKERRKWGKYFMSCSDAWSSMKSCDRWQLTKAVTVHCTLRLPENVANLVDETLILQILIFNYCELLKKFPLLARE